MVAPPLSELTQLTNRTCRDKGPLANDCAEYSARRSQHLGREMQFAPEFFQLSPAPFASAHNDEQRPLAAK
eukprot:6089468-Pyramimonas_sp.AAC.1